mmetsp:Transcript_1312/g.3506  ORF Transcript_1312/g.3506 Transcript_1312/m.3506 type:complete len:481 (+) Transcript_1312:11-1453(+)
MRRVLVASLLLAVVALAFCDENQRLAEEQQRSVVETEASREHAHQAAEKWEQHMEKLNAEVLPSHHQQAVKHAKLAKGHPIQKRKVVQTKPASKHTSVFHETAEQMEKARQAIVNAVFPESWTQTQAKHAAKVQSKLSAAAAYRQKQLAKYQHDRMLHNKAEGRTEPKAAASHVEKPKATTQQKHTSEFHETAQQMYAHRKAEVAAAFPASWSKKHVVAKVQKPTEKRAYPVTMHAKKIMSEVETAEERRISDQDASKELDHLAAVSAAVRHCTAPCITRRASLLLSRAHFRMAGVAAHPLLPRGEAHRGQEERRGRPRPAASAARLAAAGLHAPERTSPPQPARVERSGGAQRGHRRGLHGRAPGGLRAQAAGPPARHQGRAPRAPPHRARHRAQVRGPRLRQLRAHLRDQDGEGRAHGVGAVGPGPHAHVERRDRARDGHQHGVPGRLRVGSHGPVGPRRAHQLSADAQGASGQAQRA